MGEKRRTPAEAEERMTERVRNDGRRTAGTAKESKVDLRRNLLDEIPAPDHLLASLADLDATIDSALDALRKMTGGRKK